MRTEPQALWLTGGVKGITPSKPLGPGPTTPTAPSLAVVPEQLTAARQPSPPRRPSSTLHGDYKTTPPPPSFASPETQTPDPPARSPARAPARPPPSAFRLPHRRLRMDDVGAGNAAQPDAAAAAEEAPASPRSVFNAAVREALATAPRGRVACVECVRKKLDEGQGASCARAVGAGGMDEHYRSRHGEIHRNPNKSQCRHCRNWFPSAAEREEHQRLFHRRH